MKKLLQKQKCKFILMMFFAVLAASNIHAQFTYQSFSRSFTNGVASTTADCNDFNSYRAALTRSDYRIFRMRSTTSGLILTMTNPANVMLFANNLRNGVNTTLTEGANTWNIGVCGGGLEVSVNNSGNCACGAGPGNSCIRPCINNLNWGGHDGATCSAPTQTITIEFGYPSGFNDAGVESIDSPAVFQTGTRNIVARVANFGINQITSVNVSWSVNGVFQSTVPFVGLLDTFGGSGSRTALVNLGTFNFLNNTIYKIEAWTSGPNGQTDTTNNNDTATRFYRSPLSGSYTICQSGCDFTSITEATGVLNNAGVSGPVVFNLANTFYTTTTGETFPIMLRNATGMSPTNTVTFKPLSSSSAYIFGNTSGPLINITGGKYYIIDGRDTTNSTTRGITIENLSTTTAANAITLQNDAIANNIRFLNIRSANNSTASGSISILGTNQLFGNDSNIIANNYFSRNSLSPYAIGILSQGSSATAQNNNNIINNNEFNNFTFNGILVNATNNGNGSYWRIENNHFYDTAINTTQIGNWSAISFQPGTGSGSVGNRINRNFIGGTEAFAGGAPFNNSTNITRVAIQVTATTGESNQIYGNEIKNWLLPNTSNTGSFIGIQHSGGVANIDSNFVFDIQNMNNGLTNAINVTPSANYFITRNHIFNIHANNAGSSVSIRGITTSGGQTVVISNNNIRNLRTHSTNTGSTTASSIVGIGSSSSSNSITISNNIVGSMAQPLRNGSNSTALSRIVGIVATSGTNVIENNVVDGLIYDSTAVSSLGTSTSAIINGILVTSGTAGQIIRNNRVTHLIQNSTATTQTSQINGICYASSGFHTIENNIVHSLYSTSTNNSTSTSAALNGIFVASSGRTITINNYVDSLVLFRSSSPTTTQVNGILIFGTNGNRVANNTVKTLYNNFTSTSPGICGIQYVSSITDQVCEGNTIFGLVGTNTTSTGTITGIRYLASTATVSNNSFVSRNFVHSLSSVSTTTQNIIGIEIASGTITCNNNMIRLGVDTAGNLYNGPYVISGIFNNTIGTTFQNRFYHNTSYIAGGPLTGSSQTAAFRSSAASSQWQDIRNNIFVNVVTNTGSSGFNYAMSLGSTPFASSIINYNILWAGVGLTNNFIGGGPGNATVMTGISGWRRITGGREMNSIHANPSLIAPNAIAGSINFALPASNLAERAGDPNLAVPVDLDFFGNIRANNTPTDIGAISSGTATLSTDSVAPEIIHTQLTNTASVLNRTFTATIIDRNLGVQAGTLAPRVYFNKNNGTFFSSQGTLVSGDHRNGVWQFTIDYSLLSGVIPNDVIRYYIIAQDSNANYSSMPGYAVATNVNTITNAPAAPYQYIIANPIPTTVTVGPTSTYPNLTGTTGLFNAINNSLLQGNTTVLLEAGATISEPGNIALNQWLEINAGVVGNHGYTLTIRPSGNVQVVLTGNVTTTDGMIRLNGADRVRFLGYSSFGLQTDTNLIIRNIATSQPAVGLLNDASNNHFENVIFETRNANTGVTTGGAVRISTTSLITGNDNISFVGCHFRRDITNTTFPGLPGILLAASGTTGVNRENDNLLIDNCHFYNFNFNAISIGTGTGNNQVIKNSQFYQNAGFDHNISPTVINFTPGGLSNNDTISNNIIGGNAPNLSGIWIPVSNTTNISFTAINVTAGAVTGTVISNNRIANIHHLNQAANSNTFTGILVNNGGGVARVLNNYIGDTLIANNIIHSANSTTLPISIQTGSNTYIKNNIIANITNTNPAGTSVIVNGIRSWNQTGVLEIIGNRIINLKDSSNGSSTSTSACMVGINVSSSTTSITIANNHINGLQNASISAPSTNQVLGIHSTSGLANVNNNIVENLLTRSLNTSSSTGAALIGIWVSSFTPGQLIQNNIVRFLTYNNPTPTFTQIVGIMQSSGSAHQITGNIVHNLLTNSTSSNTSTSSAVIGIMHNGSGSALNISRNTIFGLEGTNTTASNNLIGILYQGTTSPVVTSFVARNFIHSFKLATTTAGRMIGTQQNSGSFTRYANNMIRLGIDSAGNPYTGPYEVYGILMDVSGNFEFMHNSIYLGGTPSSGFSVTAAIRFQGIPSGTQLHDIRNNILVNAISNGGSASGKNYGIRIPAVPTNPANMLSNYNLFHTPGTGGFVAGTNLSDFASLLGLTGWRRNSGYDLQSGSGNPQFIMATGTANDVNLRVLPSNPIEGAGDPSVSLIITEDFDGNCRSCSTAVDIGAHAGNFSLSADLFPPVISYTPLGNQGNLFGPLNLSNVNIRDNVGIPLSNLVTSPKLYYKKGAAGTYATTSASTITGNSQNANLTFELNYGAIGGVSTGDTVFYFVLAEDSLGGNIASQNPFAIASNVNTLIAEPQLPDFYTFLPVIPANTKFYVGAGQTYTTLTGAGGLFQHLNNSTIGGNITAVITSNINEPGLVALNQIGEDGSGAGTYTVTIRPDSSAISTTRILSGAANNGLIRLNGADRIKIIGIPDLSTNTSLNNLMIRNSASGPSVLFVNGAQGCRLNNLVLESSNTTAFNAVNQGVVSFAGTLNTFGNSFDSVTNCIIRNNLSVTFPLGVPAILIGSFHSGTILNSNNVITGNQLSNGSSVYVNVEVGSGNGWIVNNNHCFNNLPVITANPLPIRFNGGILSEGHTVSGNIIGGTTMNAGGAAWASNANAAWNTMQFVVGNNLPTIVSNNTIRNIQNLPIAFFNAMNLIIVAGGRTSIINNMIGDSTVSGSIVINQQSTHNGIVITGAVAVPTLISGNRLAGISLINPGNGLTFNAINVQGGITTVMNNVIGAVGTSNSIYHEANSQLRGINIFSPANIDPAIQVINNIIANMNAAGATTSSNVGGIQSTGTTAPNIIGNTIFNLSSLSSNTSLSPTLINAFGILISATNVLGTNIENNTIYNITAANTGALVSYSAGIQIQSASSAVIQRNRIYDIRNLSTANAVNPMATANGIILWTLTNMVDIRNNQITLGHNQTNNPQFNGIWQMSSGGFNINCYYNTVVITGNASSGSINSFAFHRGQNATFEITSGTRLINNVFINNRTGGTTKNYAIGNEVTGTPTGSGWLDVNYNFLASANANTIGLWGTADRNFTDWRSNSNADFNSWSEVTGIVNPNTLFANIATGNLNVVTTSPLCWYLNGKGIAGNASNNIAIDFAGNSRGTTLGFGTDIGASEFNTSTLPPALTITGTPVVNGTTVMSFAGRNIATINWGSMGTVPTSVSAQYYSGVNPPAVFGLSRYLNAYVNVSATGGSGFNYNATINYDPALLGNITAENNLRWALRTGSNWFFDNTSTVNTIAKTISTGTAYNNIGIMTGTDVTAPLPVQLLSFTASPIENKHVEVKWTTSSEINNKGFEIERSINGSDFEFVAFVKGAGNSNRNIDYNFIDKYAFNVANVLYYRLKQFDYDGTYNYSDVVAVSANENADFSSNVYPNPFIDRFSIMVNTPENGKAIIEVFDLNGKLVFNKTFDAIAGTNSFNIDNNNNFTNGIYVVKVTQGNYVNNHKVVSIK